MQPDDDFFKYLGTLNNGSTLQNTYRDYKNSPNFDAYSLNGALRSGFNINDYVVKINNLNGIIRAKNESPLDLYRITSSYEFTPSGAAVALGIPFIYPAFLSTARDSSALQFIALGMGTPTILKIHCPKGTAMALMEANKNLPNEQEILLQSNTEYLIKKATIVNDHSIISSYLGKYNASRHSSIYEIEMDVTNNSTYLNTQYQSSFYVF